MLYFQYFSFFDFAQVEMERNVPMGNILTLAQEIVKVCALFSPPLFLAFLNNVFFFLLRNSLRVRRVFQFKRCISPGRVQHGGQWNLHAWLFCV